MTPIKTMLIVDGDGLLVRSHCAVGKEIINQHNMAVGGIDKFIHVVRRQIRTWDADAVFIAFDPTGPTTLRHQQYKAYKGTRPPKEESLIYIKSIIAPIMRALGAATGQDDDYEADDLVGAMVRATAGGSWRAVVSSHDKDLLGLTENEHVVVSPPFQQEPMYAKDVVEKLNVEPSRMMDYLALLGDSVDNIPGVDGCGKVKASALLRRYGSLESIVEAAKKGEIPKKVGDNLRLQGARAIAFKKLMTLYTDAPVLEANACSIKDPDYTVLLPLLKSNNLMKLYDEAYKDSTGA